ncbi:MAG: ParA family protein, partial [Betaproteobacteria bacterium]|nr:ParA family protein [Betaproteobacteria bacterium]
MKNRIFVVVNQKGGVGKTTTAVNTAAAVAGAGKRVLLIDLDPQGNATMGCGIDKRALKRSVYQVLLGLESAQAARCQTAFGFDLLPANRDLAAAELELVNMPDRELRLKQAIASMANRDDELILIDCPPSLSMLTLNGLCAASGVIIPMQCEYYALEGLSQLLETYSVVKKRLNPILNLSTIILTMFDGRTR